MPGKGTHSAAWDDCWKKVQAKGHDEKSAAAICTASLGSASFNAAEGLREFHLRVQRGPIRSDWWNGKEYTVVPVTALVEGVIRAINSPHPEFVPAERFSVAPSGWNGRPVFLNHPMVDGSPVSGNTPEVLKSAIGTIFNARVDGKRLLMEAWLDPDKAKDLIARINRQADVEVSTGAFVLLKDGSGEHNGKAWEGAWDTIIPDHLAILDEGMIGACSVAMGCGVRAAMYALDDKGELQEENMNKTDPWYEAMTLDPVKTLRASRNIPQSERDKMDKSDFAGPGTSFPIKTQADVDAAKTLIGHADNPEAVKQRIISIAKRKGLTIPDAWQTKPKAAQGIKATVKALLAKAERLLAGAEGDDGEENDDAEETAEDITYQSLLSLYEHAEKAISEGRTLVEALIADNGANDDEDVECARLSSIQAASMMVTDVMFRVTNLAGKLVREYEEEDIQRVQVVNGVSAYAERAAAAPNARLMSKKHQKLIQNVHDHAASMGAKCDATNAYRNAEQLRAASCGCGKHGGDMTKTERIAYLVKHENSPIKDQAVLEAATDAGLEALHYFVDSGMKFRAAASKSDAEKVIKDLASAHDNLKGHAAMLAQSEKKKEDGKKDEADVKAAVDAAVAAALPKTEEDWLKIAPETVRTLVADAKAENEARKTFLVSKLKTAQSAYSETELKAMDVKQLTKLATVAGVDQPPVVDFSGRVPAPRVNQSGEEQTDYLAAPPPDGYRIAIDKQKGQSQVQKEKVN